MFSIFHASRRYPRIYAPYTETFNFYEGREKWLESITDVPREAVHLYAIHWLHLEVYNGGFWQYFFNSTGTSWPEATAGCAAIGMPEVAQIVQTAAAKLGEPFPYNLEARREIVGDSQHRMPFDDLEDRFYDLADTKKLLRRLPKFVPFAETYADAFASRRKD